MAVDAEPIADILVEGETELLAGLHQAEHGIARNAAVTRNRSAGDFSLGDEGPQVFLRWFGMQRDVGIFQHLKQFVFSAVQPRQKRVKPS